MSSEKPITKKQHKRNPWSRANPLSILTFSWLLPIFRTGLKKDLEHSDLFPAPSFYKSERVTQKFSIEWEKECLASQSKKRQPNLIRALFRFCRKNLIIYTVLLAIDELVLRVLQPISLRLLVKSFSADSDISRRDQIIYGATVCVCTFIHSFGMEHCVFLMLRTGIMCRVSISSLLYQKVIKLSPFARKDATTGKMMNLMSNDVGRFDQGFIYIAYTLLGPIQTGIFIYILWTEVGTGVVGGAAVIAFIVPLQIMNGHLTAKFRESIANLTDERSTIMNEIVMAVRVVKMMAWETPFANLVQRIRKAEVRALGNKMYLRGFYLALFTVCQKLTPFLAIMTYVLLDKRITADKAFFTVAVFTIMIENLVYYFSTAVTSLGEMWISIKRIQEVLLMEEQSVKQILSKDDLAARESTESEEYEASVCLTNACARYGPEEPLVMSNFNINIEGGKLVMVIGAVGSGKSSFLNSLISELPLSSGECNVKGSVTYAVQEPWLFAGTVKDNILFGMEFDKDKYQEVVKVSALEDDIKQLINGDMTLVGERGMALSGGQKARVNLARALYRDTDIVLLDDPLSAVDSRVSRHIFDKCIRKYLQGKLRILASHQLQYIPLADHIIVLKNGSILAQGTPSEIQSMGIDLISVLEGQEEDDEGHTRKSSVAPKETAESAKEVSDILEEEDDLEESLMMEKKVSYKTYWAYIRAGDSILGLCAVFILFILGQIAITATEYWVSVWTSAEEHVRINNNPTLDLKKPLDIFNSDYYYGDRIYLTVYGGLIGYVILCALTRAGMSFTYFLRISVNLHNKMFKSLIRAPVQFFDENPSGRIMNRFTKDIGSIDELLPPSLYDSTEYLLQSFGVVVVIIWSNYYLTIPVVVITVLVLIMRFVFLKTSRDLKRVESQAKSPVLTHLAASIQGITTIRVLKTQHNAIKTFHNLQDVHTSPWFLFLAATRSFTTWMGIVSAVLLSAITCTFLLLTDDQVAGGLIGFVITATIALTVNLQWALREAADAENYMTCVARSLEYTNLTPEADWESKNPEKKPPKEWPQEGGVRFQQVYLTYGDNHVLKDLTFEIKPKEKIGIVGRTGAGKSSIITALFRITEPTGDIYIDNVKINEIGLHELRKSISIIPQDPVLFSGTIRYNLDPFNQFRDDDIWKVLEDVQLRDAVDALDSRVEDGGANFSIGQRQLICLARAILRRNRVIVMDEATANVDPKTDAFIQATIREKFFDCSIITIAHRLQSVMDCDRVLVMEQGSMKEYNHPHILLQNKDGFLYQLVSYSGENASAHLKEIAKQHYKNHYEKE